MEIQADEFLPQVIAHRGASYEAPENTGASIKLAIGKRAKIIEFDVRQSKDATLFLFHDAKLNRCSDQTGNFKELSSAQVKQLDVGSWFTKAKFERETPLTLAEAISLCVKADCIPLIERKSGSAEVYAKVIQQLDAVDQVIVQAFDWQFIEEIRALLPKLKVGALGKDPLAEHKTELLKLKPNWVGWGNSNIKPEDIAWLKQQGFTVAIWTVNDRSRANELIEQGVDQIITDRPKYIAEGLIKK